MERDEFQTPVPEAAAANPDAPATEEHGWPWQSATDPFAADDEPDDDDDLDDEDDGSEDDDEDEPEKPDAGDDPTRPKPAVKRKRKKKARPAAPRSKPKTTVTIHSVSDDGGIVTVHGRVGDAEHRVRFHRHDLLAIENPKARGEYAARQILSVHEAGIEVPEPPEPLDLRGTYHVEKE
jgi:hypothetical protein